MESVLTKDNTEVSIDEIRAVLLQKLERIQASHDEIKVYAGCYIDTLHSKEQCAKAWFKTGRSSTEIGRDYRVLWLIGV